MKPATFAAAAQKHVDYLRPFALIGLGLLLTFGFTMLKLRFTPW